MHRIGRVLAPALLFWASAASAQTDRTAQWDQLVAAAKKEGKVVIMAPPDQAVRKALPAAFEKRYGITVDYIGGRSTETAIRLRTERAAGIYSVDVALSGNQTMDTVFYPEKWLAPLKPALLDPEVTDGSKWKRGSLWFMDPEGKYILRLFSTLSPFFYINTSIVDPKEIRSFQDLLNPKWKEKIAFHDPTISGTGSSNSARLYAQFGPEYIKKLYVDQKPVFTRNRHQITDWVLRGTYPIVFGVEDDVVERMHKQGFPLHVVAVYGLSDLRGSLTAGVGQVALFNHAPHPNAAKLFANWIASKEGLEIYARTRAGAPTRNDIDESFLPSEMIPRPDVKYFDSYDWHFTIDTQQMIRSYMKKILRKS
jgi:iron(III) transport system substrate-binding protein